MMSEQIDTWPSLRALFSDLQNDQYEIVRVESSQSDPARSKSVTVVLSREESP